MNTLAMDTDFEYGVAVQRTRVVLCWCPVADDPPSARVDDSDDNPDGLPIIVDSLCEYLADDLIACCPPRSGVCAGIETIDVTFSDATRQTAVALRCIEPRPSAWSRH